MAVKIRLTRKGKKKQPTYRVVVADSRAPRDGRYIEQIGRYDPRQEPSLVEIDTDRAKYWIDNGAQPSDAVHKLLVISGLLEPKRIRQPKVHVVDEKAQKVAEAEDAAVVAAAAETEVAAEEAAPAEEAPAEAATAEETPAEEAPTSEAIADDAPEAVADEAAEADGAKEEE
jgi:small subunit ribosomal protein S16